MIRWNSHSHKKKTSDKVAQAWIFLAALARGWKSLSGLRGAGAMPRTSLMMFAGDEGTAGPQTQLCRAVQALTGRQNFLAARDWGNLSKACAAGVLASGNSMDVKRLLTVQNLSVLCVPYNIRKKALAVLLPAAAGTCVTVWLTAEWNCMCLRNTQRGILWHTSGSEFNQVLQNSCASCEPGEGSLFFSICFMYSCRQKKCCPQNSHLGIPHLQQVLFKLK